MICSIRGAAAEKLKLGKHFRKHIKSRGKSETEKKEAKRLANRKHKDMKKGEKSAKEETEKVCEIRYAEVIEKRVKKMEVLKAQQEHCLLLKWKLQLSRT